VEEAQRPQPWTLARRLTATLVGTALLSASLAFLVHDRALQRGLRQNAEERLARAARAGELLVADHLGQLEARYRAVASAPQLRATLGLGHAPTSQHLADQLRAEQGAALIAFFAASGALHARSGDAELARAVQGLTEPALLVAGGRLHAAVPVRVELGGRQTHHVVAVEPIGDELLARWSELCGARLLAEAPEQGSGELLATHIRGGEGAAIFVAADLAPERAALASARAKLALAGSAALAVTLAACAVLARSLVRPIRQVQEAVARIGRGDLATRLASARSDEIGEVARGVDRMAEQLCASHGELAARNDELARSQAHLARAQQIARLGSFQLDLASGELMASEEFWALYAIEDPRKGTPPDELLERLHPEDRRPVLDAVRASLEAGAGAHLDYRVRLPDGSERFFQTQFQVLLLDGRPCRIEGTVQDLTERKRTEQQIRFLAYHDGLTGLGNRLLFSERVELAMARARRRGTKLGVLFLDLDDFKRINDTLGHDVGDELLREVADRLVRGAREAVLVPRELDQGFEPAVARLGGDEFTLLVTELREASDLALVAEHLLHGLQRPCRLHGHELVIHASIGIATWPSDGERVEALLASADAAMYHAKAQGKNGYQFYDASMNEVAQRRLAVEVRLRHALEHNELALHFQPKLELATGRIVGFEALARWHDGELGAVSPADFVPVAEQTGLIAKLGRWVLEEVCREASRAEAELARAGARISFNVSAREFGPRLARDIAATLEAYCVAPERLQLEITESAIMRDEEAVVAALEELRALGLSIALDDFGTGYSSLSYLRRLPVDTLKMDGSFIRAIAQDAEAAALTRSIVEMGQALGLRVVAEGVEHEAQRVLLAKWGCHEIQGFLVGAALPADAALAALSRPARRPRRR
jgi:diguanylate cyclase (GGDEF)-like protein